MVNKKKEPLIKYDLYLRENILEKVKEMAKSRNLSVSKLLREWVSDKCEKESREIHKNQVVYPKMTIKLIDEIKVMCNEILEECKKGRDSR